MFNGNFNFWEFHFADFIPILTTFLSPILVYYFYKKLEKSKEKRIVKIAFLRFKRYLETKLQPQEEREILPEGSMSFF